MKDSPTIKTEEGICAVGKEPKNGTMISEDDKAKVLDVNQFILIFGLVSEEGKKLNDCEGIILDQPTSDENGILRYPVLIFAKEKDYQTDSNNDNNDCDEDDLFSFLGDEEPQEPTAGTVVHVLVPLLATSTKKIKADNLSLVPHLSSSRAMFRTVATKEKKNCEEDRYWKDALFWAKLLQQVFPNDFWIVLNYIGLLRDHGKGKKDRKLAYAIVRSYTDKIPPSENCYHILCYELFATHYALHKDEQNQMQTSLDLALNIPTGITKEANQHAHQALLIMEQDYHQFMTNDRHWDGRTFLHPEIATNYLRCVKAVLSLVPPDDVTNVDRFDQLGTYFAVTRENLKAAKCYRRAFQITQELPPGATGTAEAKRTTALAQLKQKLTMAQLGCPGMLYDGYHIVRMTETHDYGVELSRLSEWPNVDEQEFRRPTDPDDVRLFPDTFLAKISTDIMEIFDDFSMEDGSEGPCVTQ